MTLLLSSCSEDSIFSTSDSDGLHLALQIGESTIMQRAISTSSDDALKEDVLNDLNVWIYDPNNSDALIKHYYLSSNLSNNQTSLLQGGASWRSDLTAGNTYQVYAVANNGSDLGSLALADLKTRTISDKNIYIPYNTTSNSSKRFIMDGKTAWTVPATTQNEINIPMTLRRAASKIVVHLNFSSEMQGKLTAVGPVTWRLKNYSSEPTIIAEGSLDDRKVENNPGETTPLSITLADTKNTSTFLTYTYANDSTLWNTDPIAHQTLLMLDMPCTYDGKTYAENTYSIPITTSHIDRNYIYELDATIGKLSSNASETEPAYLKYYILPWVTGDVIPINGSNTSGSYLYVTPDTTIMKQTTTDNSIEYISSKNVSIQIDSIYYFNTLGVKTLVASSIKNQVSATPTSTSNLRQGNLLVTSPIPTNLGPRYIKIIFSNGTDSKTVLVKQYPLEYITSISGSYSYKDDGNGTQVLNSYDPKAKKYTRGTINKPKDDIFTSKYYDASYSMIYETGTKLSRFQGAAQTTNPNNQMYVVRITTTSSKYIVDKPILTNGVTDGSAANNNVVSPAFMLASQLGTVLPTTWDAASDHCKKYVEISTSGKKYDDWRLPTLAELEIISTYQVQSGQNVMTTVLAGNYYWSAYHIGSGTWIDDTYDYVGFDSGDYSLCNSDGYYYVGSGNGNYSYGYYWSWYNYGYYPDPGGDYRQGTPGTYYYVGSRNGSYKYVAGYWNYSDNYGYYGTGYDNNSGNYTGNNIGRFTTTSSSDTHYIRCIRDMSPEELSNDK